MPYYQDAHGQKHILRIDTDLNNRPEEKQYQGDPLLLVKLDGVEAVSQLFAYDVVMIRDAGGFDGEKVNGQKRPPIDATSLIGTNVTFAARKSTDGKWWKRVGMFETFEDLLDLDITGIKNPLWYIPSFLRNLLHLGNIPTQENIRDFHVYRARIVPWVKVLNRDISYRIFENKTVVEIIDAIATEAHATYPNVWIDTTTLKSAQHPFAPMEYCVQYGESTLSFLYRLMARFGIWFFFGHGSNAADDVLNETMYLRGYWDNRITQTQNHNVKIGPKDPNTDTIAKLVRRFRPPERRVAVGGFNYLDPTKPYYKAGTVDTQDDLLKKTPNEPAQPSQTEFFGATSFAQPLFSDADAEALEETAHSQNQSEVFLLSCVTTNNSFLAGRSFHIERGAKFDPNDNEAKPYLSIIDKSYMIDTLAIAANDFTYVNLRLPIPGLSTVVQVIADAFRLSGIFALQGDAVDNTNNALYATSLWATKTAEAKIYTAVNPLYGDFAETASGLALDYANVADAVTAALSGAGAFGGLVSTADFRKAVTDVINEAVFAIGVIAVPVDAPFNPTLPLSGRPVVRGPHTAVVIGGDSGQGVNDANKGHDIWADALGRVRVRFPWDPGPPQADGKIPPVFPYAQSDKPTTVGKNTCWVRVSEGWAGRHYGTQFLPRIGQEVLVEFLDGDPERPVITGRLYNADKGTTNLAFPPNAWGQTVFKKLSDFPPTASEDLRYSGIKTWSVPTREDDKPLPARYHLLRFDDTRGKEQYLIRSQYRLDITAFNSRYETIGLDRNLTVGGKSYDKFGNPLEIHGDYITKIYKHYYLHVGDPDFIEESGPKSSGNRITRLELNEKLFVNKKHQLDAGTYSAVTGDYYLHVSANQTGVREGGPGDRVTYIDGKDYMHVRGTYLRFTEGWDGTVSHQGVAQLSKGSIYLEARESIIMIVGQSSIMINPGQITLNSPLIVANQQVTLVPGAVGPTPSPPQHWSQPPINDPVIPPPLIPTNADPGNSVTPPEDPVEPSKT